MTDKTLVVTDDTPAFVAVYGTLLSDFHNNYLLQDSPMISDAKSLFWGTMYSNGGFPILSLDEPASLIKVELYRVTSQEVMDDLDSLEGFPGWYDRSIRTFTTMEGEKVKAWIYHQDKALPLPVVESGCWKTFKNGSAV